MPSATEILETVEVWRDIPGTGGWYQASTLGRVRSIARKMITATGVERLYKERIFSPPPVGKYSTIDLRGANKRMRIGYHVAICMAFHGVAEGMEACHNDGNVNNNIPFNLRWGTPKENASDRIPHGTHIEGEKHSLARLSASDVVFIRDSLRKGTITGKCLAEMFGVSAAKISQIKLNQSWKHVA